MRDWASLSPGIISFSGGRSSGYMLHRILEECGGALPEGWRVLFANTGKEMPETLDFVRDCGEWFGVEIVWLEYYCRDGKHAYRIVNHESAARNGEPFAELIEKKKMLPNAVRRFCTEQLKIETMRRYLKDCGVTEFTNVIGLRADEPRRLAKMRWKNEQDSKRYTIAPMGEWGMTKRIVGDFWRAMPFDLALQNQNGVTPEGNCDFCFLKGAGLLSSLARDYPKRLGWWIEQEESIKRGPCKAENARFIKRFPMETLPGLTCESLLDAPVACIGCTD